MNLGRDPSSKEIETYSVILDVPMYMQKTDYYSGPACVEMIIDYVNGPSNNQETYHKFMKTTQERGTDIEAVEKALNNYQSKYHYDKRRVDNYPEFLWRALYSMESGFPFVANINTKDVDPHSWYYSKPGHYIVVTGMVATPDKRFTMYINDPWKVGKTTKQSMVLFDAINAHWDSSIIH